MSLILYAIFIAHLNSYKEFYGNMFATFAVSYILKRIVKSAGQKENSELIGLAGYSLTAKEFFRMLGAMKENSKTKVASEEVNKAIGGLVGHGVDWIKDLIVK